MAMTPPLAPALFDLEPGVLWVMHCAEGPVPRAAIEAVQAFLPREARPWTLRFEKDFIGLPSATRTAAAALLGARTEDITLTPTTSSGLVSVAQGFPWRPGDEVVTPRGEFPANAWPWKALAARDVSQREVSLWLDHRSGRHAWDSPPPSPIADPEARLLAAIGPRTRILAVSWVRFQDGLVLDLGRLAEGCAARGVDLVVDGIQGAGTLPLALNSLDGLAAFASGGHKGLLAPQGLGILWTAPAFRHRLVPSGSWLSVADATDFSRPSTDFDRPWSEDGTRLEAGVPNLLGCAAFHAALALLVETGTAAIASHIAALREALLERLATSSLWCDEAERLRGLQARGRLGAILALHHGGRGAAAVERILQAGFARRIYASVREGYLRIALHGWHTEEDVERLAAWLTDPAHTTS